MQYLYKDIHNSQKKPVEFKKNYAQKTKTEKKTKVQ